MSFIQRQITVLIELANGQFGNGGNSLTLSGLRCNMRIDVMGGGSQSNLQGAIYGMPLSDMNQLSTVGRSLTMQSKNTITVMAGDAQSGMAMVYKGTLTNAYVDAQAMPNVAFRVTGTAGAYERVMQVKPTSVQGSADVATLIGNLAQQMGFQFENNGVATKLANPYYYGSPMFQVHAIARHAGIEHILDRDTIAIWKPGQARSGDPVMISPANGMVGYPLFNQANVIAKTIFNPAIKYGGSMQIQSDLTPACGAWNINYALLELDSLFPHGRWFATLSGVDPNAPQSAGS